MYEVGQVLYRTGFYPTIPITRHTITEKLSIADADGNRQTVYFLSGYGVYFPEKKLVEEFSVAENEEA